MSKDQLPGMQLHALDAHCLRRLRRSAICRVTGNRRTLKRQMCPNLMRATGQWLGKRQRKATSGGEHLIARARGLARWRDDHAPTVERVAAERRIDLAVVGRK